MPIPLTILFTIFGLLVTMLGIIAKKEDNIEVRKILAWLIFIIGTLILPSIFFIWLSMQIFARILAPSTNDISEFVTQISWYVGGAGAVYPLIWGGWLYPNIKKYISEKFLLLPVDNEEQGNKQKIKKAKGNAK